MSVIAIFGVTCGVKIREQLDLNLFLSASVVFFLFFFFFFFKQSYEFEFYLSFRVIFFPETDSVGHLGSRTFTST